MLMDDFLNLGFKTVVCAADARHFGNDQMGKIIDKSFVTGLPPEVDPCGENGEFHTFVYDGPVFKNSVVFQQGEVVEKVYRYSVQDANGNEEHKSTAFLFRDLLVNY
jgi:diphthamide synthase (EF-2-diphthine--ammonia ligase)